MSELRELIRRYDRALNEGNAEAIAGLFADDAVMMPPNEPVITGRAAILTRHASLFDTVSLRHSLQSDERVVADPWAFDRGTYDMAVIPFREGQSWQEKGNYVTIFKKQADGTWKIQSDIWNCSQKTLSPNATGKE